MNLPVWEDTAATTNCIYANYSTAASQLLYNYIIMYKQILVVGEELQYIKSGNGRTVKKSNPWYFNEAVV